MALVSPRLLRPHLIIPCKNKICTNPPQTRCFAAAHSSIIWNKSQLPSTWNWIHLRDFELTINRSILVGRSVESIRFLWLGSVSNIGRLLFCSAAAAAAHRICISCSLLTLHHHCWTATESEDMQYLITDAAVHYKPRTVRYCQRYVPRLSLSLSLSIDRHQHQQSTDR